MFVIAPRHKSSGMKGSPGPYSNSVRFRVPSQALDKELGKWNNYSIGQEMSSCGARIVLHSLRATSIMMMEVMLSVFFYF